MNDIEIIRNKIKKTRIILYFILIIIVILFDIFIRKDSYDGALFFVIIFYSGICVAIVDTITEKSVIRMKKQFKKYIFLESVKNKISIVSYDENTGILENVIKNLNIMSMGNTYKSECLFHGNYKNIQFEGAEIHITWESPNGDGADRVETSFKGLWFTFDFSNNFKHNFKIIDKKFAIANRGIYSDKISKKISYFEDYIVNIDNKEFNNNFKLYTFKQENYFNILTNERIKKFLSLKEHISGDLLFCFINNKLHIGIHNYNNLFKINVYKKPEYELKIKNFSELIDNIILFVDSIESDIDLFNN